MVPSVGSTLLEVILFYDAVNISDCKALIVIMVHELSQTQPVGMLFLYYFARCRLEGTTCFGLHKIYPRKLYNSIVSLGKSCDLKMAYYEGRNM